jgi:hypothetical protein
MRAAELHKCHDCGVEPGQMHSPGCDMEMCAYCGRQLLSCNCVYDLNNFNQMPFRVQERINAEGPTSTMWAVYEQEVAKLGGPLPWTGESGGAEACRKLGLWCYWGGDANPPMLGWIECEAEHPLAREDLNALASRCRWDREKREYVLRDG